MSLISNSFNMVVGSPSSSLEAVAGQMGAGTWSSYTMGGMSQSLLDAGGGQAISEYVGRGHWDYGHRKLQFWGMGHEASNKLITWDDATNQWSNAGPSNHAGIGHGYYHLALNKSTGDLYLRVYNSGNICKKPYGQSWTTATGFSNINNQVAGALEWFPLLNGGAGGLAFADVGGVRYSNAAVTSWSSQINAASGNYHNWGVALADGFYFGGGQNSNNVWRLNANGTVTSRTSSPVSINILDKHVVAHPNGNDLIAVPSSGTMYRYTASSNSWTSIGSSGLGGGSFWFGFCVAEYGVTVWVRQATNQSAPACFVYKPPV